MQNLWLAFLGAELLLPSSLMLPLFAGAFHAIFSAAAIANIPTGLPALIVALAAVLLVMIAFQKLFLFLACWWVMILACPQRTMRECTVGLFAIEPMTPPSTETFPMWWRWLHFGFLLTGLLLMGVLGEAYNPKIFVGDWSWTGLFLCKGFCMLTVPETVKLAMDFKESPDALALLITSPARWPKISMVGLLIRTILTFSLTAEVKEQSMLMRDPLVELLLLLMCDPLVDPKLWNSFIFGLSFFGAWLFPWMAAFVATFQSFDVDQDGNFFELFLDQLMPNDANVTPLSIHRHHSLNIVRESNICYCDMTRVPSSPAGHIVMEATNLIAARRGRTDTLVDLLRSHHPGMTMEQVLGPRGYARVKITMENEDAVKATIKDIARARGVRTTIKVVERVFYSPRD